MGGGHAVFVIDLAIGGMRVVIGCAVPAGNSNFSVKDGTDFWCGLRWELRGRSLFRGRRWWCGGLDMMVTAAGDGEAQDQQSGQSSAQPGKAARREEFRSFTKLMLPCCESDQKAFGGNEH